MEKVALAEQSMREIPASEILAKIEKGEPVEYDNVIIKGNLDTRKLNLRKDDKYTIIDSQIKIINSSIKGKLNFQNAIISKQAFFDNTYFGGYSCFLGVQFRNGAWFRKSIFSDGAVFNQAIFDFQAVFPEAKFLAGGVFIKTQFNCDALFERAWFIFDATFNEAQFNADAHFWGTQFKRSALFDNAKFNKSAYFWKKAYFGEYAQFLGTQFNGDVLTFKTAVFGKPIAQEQACRRAKMVLEKNGNREEAGYHFYREMEARRKNEGSIALIYDTLQINNSSLKAEIWSALRHWSMIKRFFWYDIVEYVFVQGIFGYGVHPERLIISWGAMVAAFSILYLIGNGLNGATQLFDYLKFSLAAAIAPGYIATIISPGSTGYSLRPEYQAVAIIESIFGTFMWAAFIATFARKYMR